MNDQPQEEEWDYVAETTFRVTGVLPGTRAGVLEEDSRVGRVLAGDAA